MVKGIIYHRTIIGMLRNRVHMNITKPHNSLEVSSFFEFIILLLNFIKCKNVFTFQSLSGYTIAPSINIIILSYLIISKSSINNTLKVNERVKFYLKSSRVRRSIVGQDINISEFRKMRLYQVLSCNWVKLQFQIVRSTRIR